MRILVVHNRYQYAGGEDAVFAAETALLRSAGHDVVTEVFDNDSIAGPVDAARTALRAPYNSAARRRIAARIARDRPAVMHVHNWFPQASPAIFDAAAAAGIAAVWTLHNFRVTCLNGLLFRDGAICEECLGKAPWPGIRHRCYRGSLAGSAVVAATDTLHARRGTWDRRIARLIALNSFARDKFVAAGLPAERLVVKPNFIPDPGAPDLAAPDLAASRDRVLFIGRLSPEKGVATLVRAWRGMPLPLHVIGTGPQEGILRGAAGPDVHFAGHLNPEAIAAQLRRAALVVIPSEWFENFPMVLVEALAHGVPVLVSTGGALQTLIDDGVEGWHFAMGDAADLARVAVGALGAPAQLAAAARAARRRYERELTPAANLARLETIYAEAIGVSAC